MTKEQDGITLEDEFFRAPIITIQEGIDFKLVSGKTYIFKRLTVHTGGTISIVGDKDWTKLIVQESLILKGKLFCKGFSASINRKETIEEMFNGHLLSHTYRNDKLGGSGGYGAGRVIYETNYPGSVGASGDPTYGGGGGGGGIGIEGRQEGKITFGKSAKGRFGGQGGQVPNGRHGGKGGDGGKNSPVHGGLLYIQCDGSLDGDGGLIDLCGEPGENGENGFYVSCGAGGGGGGAPGGNGGKLILNIPDNQILPDINVSGGVGGLGGKGKNGCSDWVPQIERSGDGTQGESGHDGVIEYI